MSEPTSQTESVPAPEARHAAPPAPLPSENLATAREEVNERADTVWVHPDGPPPLPPSERQELTNEHGRVAIVAGARTPFVKSGTELGSMDVVDLSGVAASGLMARTGIDPAEIDMSVFGVVIPALNAPNLGREVVFRTSLPDTAVGTTVNLACASSNRAITFGAEAILKGEAEVVLAGGAESLSNVPIRFSDDAAKVFMKLSKAKTLADRAKVLATLRPGDLAPVAPAIAEYTTGQTMGESAEKMAKENDVSRRAQDEIALWSHHRAAAAQAEGRFADQIVPTFPPPKHKTAVDHDTGVRADTSLEALSGLRTVFDKRYGTLTAGNSSPLTDGASAVLLMSEEKAEALGYEPLGYIRSFCFTGVDPANQLLQGPAYAAPVALERAGLTFADMDLVEMHEAFAAQVLSNLKALASKKFAQAELGRDEPVAADVDFDKINVNGGSIAIGHPFGATGARVTMQLLHELKRREKNLGLITVCAAGGTGFAMVVERN